ncbi:MAG: molybdopterin biosynthesis protein MoeB [Citromicrobium sp.]|nr:MAG: molybdopterin biosynthesis protein MoeB [Citromicrobium sp.]
MILPEDRLDRFARHIVLPEIGGAGQVALAGKHLVLVGLGGIGSPALQYIAAAGIGRLTLVDDDRVEASNLQRQTLFNTRDIGHGKAVVAKRWVTGFDPALDVAISDRRIRVPLLSAAVGRFQGQVGAFAGHMPGEACYRCFVGDAFDTEDCDSCADDGMLGAMAGWVATFAALQAVRVLLDGVGNLGPINWGQVHLLDGLAPGMRSFAIAKDSACKACGSPR